MFALIYFISTLRSGFWIQPKNVKIKFCALLIVNLLQFIYSQVKNPKVWSVSEKTLHLQPEETREIEVSCYLNDTVKYSSVLACDVKNRGVLKCRLLAKGIGTAIQVTPKIGGICDLGPQLTKTVITKKFLFKNCGNRFHKIIASPQKIIKNFQNYDPNQVR